MNLSCYNDFQGWGRDLAVVAEERGHTAKIFRHEREPSAGYVFTHMHHHPDHRAADKHVMAQMALRPELTLIPEYRSSVLYDDKAEQARQMSTWMPRTEIVLSLDDVDAAIERIGLPLMSKNAEGAGSHNVRLVKTRDQAFEEAKLAFGAGIKAKYDRAQTGYLLWQKFLPGNAYDYRVIAIGRRRMILKRFNRRDRPMASGSGKFEPVNELNAETRSMLDFSNEFFDAQDFRWCGIDVVKDGRDWSVLETTVGWTFRGYLDCKFFGPGPDRCGAETWHTLIDEIEAGVFDV